MLRMIRTGIIDNPWFFRIIMGSIALMFVISMGWWNFSESREGQSAAEVNGVTIPMDAYRRAYKNVANIYRDLLKEHYNDKDVRKRVIDQLVDQQLWLAEARLMGVAVSDEELRESLNKRPEFQENGVFSPKLYSRILAFERITPADFEQRIRESRLVEKAEEIVKGAVALTPSEVEDAKEAAKRASPDNYDLERAMADALVKKQQRAILARTHDLRRGASITLNDTVLQET